MPRRSCALLCVSFFYCSGDHRDLHSFPTRRSSDLRAEARRARARLSRAFPTRPRSHRPFLGVSATERQDAGQRSEEHTSELQSPYDLVCRLLLEKKKKKKKYTEIN